jgi:hypothetical protein
LIPKALASDSTIVSVNRPPFFSVTSSARAVPVIRVPNETKAIPYLSM